MPGGALGFGATLFYANSRAAEVLTSAAADSGANNHFVLTEQKKCY
jgi:hypothetical protein